MKKIYVGTIAAMLFFMAPVNSFAQESQRSANTTNVADDDDDDDGGKWGLAGLLGLLGLAGLTRRKDNDRDVRLPRTDR